MGRPALLALLLLLAVQCVDSGTVSLGIEPRVSVNASIIRINEALEGGPALIEASVVNEGNVPVTISPLTLIGSSESRSLVRSTTRTLEGYLDETGYVICVDPKGLGTGTLNASLIVPYFNEYRTGFVQKDFEVGVKGSPNPENILVLSAPDVIEGTPGGIEYAEVEVRNLMNGGIKAYVYPTGRQDFAECTGIELKAGEAKKKMIAFRIPETEQNISLAAGGIGASARPVTVRLKPAYMPPENSDGQRFILMDALPCALIALGLFLASLHVSARRVGRRFEELERHARDSREIEERIRFKRPRR